MARIAEGLLDPGRYPVVRQVSTRFADIDPNRHINNVAMAAVFEDGRAHFTWSIGLSTLLGSVRVMIVTGYYDYLAEAHYPEPLTLHLAVTAIGRTSFTLGQIAMQDGLPRAYCTSVLVATQEGKPTPLPDYVREKLMPNRLRDPA